MIPRPLPPLPPLPTAALGLVAGLLLPTEPWGWLLAPLLTLDAATTWGRPLLRGLLLGGLLAFAAPPPEGPAPGALADLPRQVDVEGQVAWAEVPQPGLLTFVLDVGHAFDGARALELPTRILLRVVGSRVSEVHPGDRVRALVRLTAVPGPRNPGERDARPGARRAGIRAWGRSTGAEALVVLERSTGLAAALARTRARACGVLDGLLEPEDAGLARALLLGDRGALSPRDVQRFRDAGQVHLVAVSGQHVALVLAATLALVRALGARRRLAALVGLVAIALYVPISGSAPSAVRSGLGASLWLLARLLGRHPSGLPLLAAVGLGMLVASPLDLLDPGFALSFGAVLGIEVLTPRLYAAMVGQRLVLPGLLEPRRPRARAALAVALGAWLGSAPVALVMLGQTHLAAAPLSLLAVPLAALLLGLSALALLAAPCPPLAAALAGALSATADLLRWVLELLVPLGFTNQEVCPPGPLWLVCSTLALLLAGLGPPRWLRWALLAEAGLLLHALTPASAAPPPGPEALVLRRGRDAALLLRTPDGACALLMPGHDRSAQVARRLVAPALRTLGVTRLNLVLLDGESALGTAALEDALAPVVLGRVRLAQARDGDDHPQGPDPAWRTLWSRAWRDALRPGAWATPSHAEERSTTAEIPEEHDGALRIALGATLQVQAWRGPSPPRPAPYDRPVLTAPAPAALDVLWLASALAAFALLSVHPLRWLRPGGAVAAWALGTSCFAALGWPALAALFAPFVVATLLGKLPGAPRDRGRSLRQVLSNGLPAALGAALALAGHPDAGAALLLGGLACLGADTAATEIGTRYGGTPHALLTGQALAPGESGGVTRAGLAASVGGSLLAPLAYALAVGAGPAHALVPLASAAGVAGALLDSALGAALQYRGRDPLDGRVVEQRVSDGRRTQHVRGLRWLDNDAVNLVSGLLAALIALALLG